MLIEGQDALLENMAGKPATATSRKHDCFYCLQGPSARRSWWPLVALFWRFPFSTVSGPHIQGEKGPKIVCRSTTWFLKAWQYTEILPTVSAASIFPSMSFKEGFFAVNSRPEQSIKKEKPRCRNSGNLPNWSKYPWMRPGHGFDEGIAQTLQFKNRQVISIVPDGVHTHSNSLYPFSPSKARYIYIYPSYNTYIYISLSWFILFIYVILCGNIARYIWLSMHFNLYMPTQSPNGCNEGCHVATQHVRTIDQAAAGHGDGTLLHLP